MGERSDQPIDLVRLVMEFGESVEVDGSTLFDPVADERVPAVVLRMPRGRAAWFGRVLDAYTRVCRLAGVELDAAESGLAWALSRAASAAGMSIRGGLHWGRLRVGGGCPRRRCCGRRRTSMTRR